MNTKKELITFFLWLRNGTCFVVTWFLILILIAGRITGADTISMVHLRKILFGAAGGVLIFCLSFTGLFIRKSGFTARLTFFMTAISVYEILFFYNIGFFKDAGHFYQWLLFFTIVLSLYFICIAIYVSIRKKKSKSYTLALQKYQQKRRMENE